MITILQADDLTPLDDFAVPSLEAGQDSGTVTVHVWNEQGNPSPGGAAAANVVLLLQTEDLANPGTFLAAGLPPQDEQWGRIRIVGQDNGGDPSWTVQATAWRTWGAYAGFLVGTIPADCAVYVEIRMHPPGFADTAISWRWQIVVLRDEFARPAPPHLAATSGGVLTFAGDPAASFLIRGREVTATGTPDDFVHVAPGLALLAGLPAGFITADVQLNQQDGAAAALAAGESYLAVLTQAAGGVTDTRGLKAVAPVPPAAPAGEPLLAIVTVVYQAGGTSVIQQSDVGGIPAYGRLLAVAGAGLDLLIYPGQALGGDTWRFLGNRVTVALADDDTNYVWQVASGLFDVTQVEAPPETTADLIWQVTTATGAITAIVDRRPYAGRSRTIVLKGAGPGSPALVDEQMVEDPELLLEAVVLRASDNGGGSAGETVADLEVNGSTAFIDQATEDLRPRVAFDAGAAALVDRSAVHQLGRLRRGDVVSFFADAVPTGGSPARVELHLVCRVP